MEEGSEFRTTPADDMNRFDEGPTKYYPPTFGLRHYHHFKRMAAVLLSKDVYTRT